MQNRTFLRTMLDIFFNNAFFKSIISFVKFCNEQQYYNNRELKFLKNMPIDKIGNNPFYQNKFVFNTNNAIKPSLK